MPVKLEPGKTYVLGVNSERFHGFQDTRDTPPCPTWWFSAPRPRTADDTVRRQTGFEPCSNWGPKPVFLSECEAFFSVPTVRGIRASGPTAGLSLPDWVASGF